MDLDKMLKVSKALKITAKTAKILQLVVVSFATYKAIKLACTIFDEQ